VHRVEERVAEREDELNGFEGSEEGRSGGRLEGANLEIRYIVAEE
jgi:hypothetical protein